MSARVVRSSIAAILIAGGLGSPSLAAADTSCGAVLGGNWDEHDGACVTQLTSQRQAIMTMTIGYPRELIDDPTAGPPLRAYLRNRVDDWRTTGATMVRANEASVDSTVYSHGPVRSVVFHEYWWTVGNLQNNAFHTYTFDLGSGRRLQLADLVTPGVDPLAALPALVRPFLTPVLDSAQPPHDPGTYPFTPEKFEPQPDGSGYSGNYRAFALSGDELILYLPDAQMAHENPWPQDRFVWSMDGGTVEVHVPLSALTTILRPQYR
jgi:hypothetical protein